MSLYLLVEKEFVSSSWCVSILEGLNSEKKRKKIKLISIDSIDEIIEDSYEFKSSVILIGAKQNWVIKQINETLSLKLNPILISNTLISADFSNCNIVTSDIFGSVNDAFSLSNHNSANEISLYGVNSDSVADLMRKKAYLSLGGSEGCIYYNMGSLENCFENFLPYYNNYKTIICVNDFAAVSLISRLKKENLYNNKIAIISLSGSLLGRRFSPSVTSFSINYKNFGAAAILIHETLTKNAYISSFNTLIKYDLNKNNTTDLAFPKARKIYNIPKNENEINIYNDSEMSEMLSVENFLKNSDHSDALIIKMLKNKDNYDCISEATFLSISTIKYRIKNICKIFNQNNIYSVINILEKYIDI